MPRGPVRKTRETEQKIERYETYMPPSQFDIPQEVKNYFEERNFHLRWIRVLLDNQDDYKNIAKRRREGYEPVGISELPETVRDLFETKSFGPNASKYSNIATVGDLALFKIPIRKAVAREHYYESLAINNELAQRKNLSGDSKLNKILPIIDESKTEVRVGNRNSAPSSGFGKTLHNAQLETTSDDYADE